MKNKNIICYSEMAVENPERAQKFYNELFGWNFVKADGAPMDYWMLDMGIDMSKGDEGIPAECKTVPAGLGMMKKFPGHPGFINYILVESIDESTKKIEELGGKIIKAKQAVPTHGYFTIFTDTESNMLAIWENNSEAQ